MLCLTCKHVILRKLVLGVNDHREVISCDLDGWRYERGGVESCSRREVIEIKAEVRVGGQDIDYSDPTMNRLGQEILDVGVKSMEQPEAKRGWPLGKKRK